MRGITVSVDYGDLLGITLPRNARHFFEVLVVSAEHDEETRRVVASVPNARLYVTDAFYRLGAEFNKGLAMEEGFDQMVRTGWMTIFDADTLLPDRLRWEDLRLHRDNLYVPPRRILADPSQWREDIDWATLPLKHEPNEYPGYCQIFHAETPRMVVRPWYGTDWKHAGGCDSVFQRHWPPELKKRPPFEVLHLGEDGKNWMGRATPRLDGSILPGSHERSIAMQTMFRNRHKGGHRYAGEKLDE